ncbi:MAG: hypothetical protein KJ077_41365 [Anaerolineae bacterium]|nr:hypothetical protein [Anaerolineae bacterium]
MNSLSRDEIKILSEKQPGLCVSIFMPTHRLSMETRQDSTLFAKLLREAEERLVVGEGAFRFKNLLREAEEHLAASGTRSPHARDWLGSARTLGEDDLFWRQQSGGLAVFLGPQDFRTYRLPLTFEQKVVVGHRFYLKPLLPLLSGDENFCILSLSQSQVKLLQGTRYRIAEIKLKNAPASLADAFQYHNSEKQLHLYSHPAGGVRGRSNALHHHNSGSDKTRERLYSYFRQIDRGLCELLQDEKAPLILAGDDYLFSLYKEANTYPYLIHDFIPGNPNTLKPETLQAQVWTVLKPFYLKSQRQAAARYRQLAGAGRTSHQIKQIVPAACQGRVACLFVALDRQQWGYFDPVTNLVELHQEAEPGDEDLLDFAAVQTFINGGTIYAVESEQMPEETPLAAVFR